MPVAPETSTDGRKTSFTPRDRTRPSTGVDRERRQTLGAVGRVASRVRTSGINRLQAAFASQRDNGGHEDDDVDASPWGVGKAAVLDENGLPVKQMSLTKSGSKTQVCASPTTPLVETESVSPGSSATSVPNSGRPNLLQTPGQYRALTIGMSKKTFTKHKDAVIDPSSPLSAGSSSASSASGTLGPLLTEDRARPNAPNGVSKGLAGPQGLSLFPANGSIFCTMAVIPPARTTSNLETEAAKQKIVLETSNDILRKTSKVTFRASVDVQPPQNNSPGTGELSKSTSKRNVNVKMEKETSDPNPLQASELNVSPSGSGGHEKSLFRSLLGRSKLHKDPTNRNRSPDRRKTTQGIGRNSSTLPLGYRMADPNLVTGSDDVTLPEEGQMRAMSKSMELRKMRTKRSKEREDNRLRGLSGWFSHMRAGGTEHGGSDAKSIRTKVTANKGRQRESTGFSSSVIRIRSNGVDQQRQKSPKREEISSLNFADDEFYDSDEDEEQGGNDGRAAPSLAKDDFVSYQTSQKRRAPKVRVSMMRL